MRDSLFGPIFCFSVSVHTQLMLKIQFSEHFPQSYFDVIFGYNGYTYKL